MKQIQLGESRVSSNSPPYGQWVRTDPGLTKVNLS